MNQIDQLSDYMYAQKKIQDGQDIDTMERAEPKGVGSNELGSHTAKDAATHNSDFRLVSDLMVREVATVWRSCFLLWSFLGFHCRSPEARER